MKDELALRVRSAIREVADFPKAGINYFDITTVLKDGALFQDVVNFFASRYEQSNLDALVAIESRGFILGGALSHHLAIPFVPARKPGKLPSTTERIDYDLEYGQDSLEIHTDALHAGDRVLIIDDLLATGGTARATVDLVGQLNAEVVECAFMIELDGLGGADKLSPTPFVSLLECAP